MSPAVTHEAPDAGLVRVMTQVAERVLASEERPDDVAIDAMGALGGLLTEASHGGIAYLLWAEISDLCDDPRGPGSAEECNKRARAAASDWPAVDRDSVEAVDSYFERWDPRTGTAWQTSGGM